MSELARYSILFLIAVFVAAAAQVLLKKAAMKKYPNFIAEYLNPTVIFAYILFFGATLVDVFAYKVIPLSLGPILEATAYIYVTIFGVTIFHEKVNKKEILALGIIIVGIIVYAVFG